MHLTVDEPGAVVGYYLPNHCINGDAPRAQILDDLGDDRGTAGGFTEHEHRPHAAQSGRHANSARRIGSGRVTIDA